MNHCWLRHKSTQLGRITLHGAESAFTPVDDNDGMIENEFEETLTFILFTRLSAAGHPANSACVCSHSDGNVGSELFCK